MLLLGSLALVGDAKAQDTDPVIQFEDGKTRYLEGEDVVIKINSAVVDGGEKVTVSCVEDCPHDGISYTEEILEGEAGGGGDGFVELIFASNSETGRVFFPEAQEDGQPAWNGTWEVDLQDSTYSREFEVFLVKEFDLPTENYEPSMVATIQASGYEPGIILDFRIYHDPPDEERELVHEAQMGTGTDSRMANITWGIPVSVAQHLDCPDGVLDDCRRFTVEVEAPSGSKGLETTSFRIDPATIRLDVDTVANPDDTQRTETFEGQFPLVYEGSRLQDGVTPRYLSPADTHGNTSLVDVHFQRLPDTCGGGSNPENVTTVTGFWTPFGPAERAGYLADHTTPRDFPLKTAGSEDQFRWALAKQEDAYGNKIPYQGADPDCFDIDPYELTPKMWDIPDDVERKKEETFVLNFSYANLQTLDEGDNATRLQGALVPLTQEGEEDPSVDEIKMEGRPMGHGLWKWSHKLPKDFQELGPWRFEFQGAPPEEDDAQEGTRDQWGNRLLPNASEPLQVVPARPLVSISTSVDGQDRNATRGFDRGDDVNLRVRTLYPDGRSLNASDLHEDLDGKLPVKVYRKEESGAVTSITDLELPELTSTGLWQGEFRVPKESAGAPLGTWEIEVTVRDNVTNPNENTSRFPREVHPDILQVSTVDPPARDVTAGRQVSWSFAVSDGDGERVTDEDTGDQSTGTITVDVRRWNNGVPGGFVATGLEPNFNPERAGGSWEIAWTPPRSLEPGEYVLAPNGTDIHGNPVAERARSRPIDVSIERVPRDTIVAPPLTVERGDNVTVIFDGRDGDTGRNGSEHPVIRLERKAGPDRWITEEEDVRRENRTSAGDHVAVWKTGTSTPEDEYRFRISGRAPDGSIIDATSHVFEVKPKDVTRPVIEPLVPFAKKGTTVTAVVGHRPFDSLGGNDIRISGPQNITDAPGEKTVDTTRENWTISWTIPVSVPKGEYVMHVQGKDQFGNNITVTLGPVRAGPVNLTVEPIRLPAPDVPRNSPANFVFRVTYPDDSLMEEDHGTPDVVVTRGGTPVSTANLTYDGVNWHARYVPPPAAELGTYRFQVSGADRASNEILPLESRSFQVETGTVEREVREGPPGLLARLQTVEVQVAAASDDRGVEFVLEYHGQREPGPGELDDPEFTGRLSHEWRPSLGAYQVQWTPPKDQNVGIYTIAMEGQDAQGNSLTARTETFQIQEANIDANWRGDIEDVTPGAERTYSLELTYLNDEPMTDAEGEPATFVQLNGRPVEPRPEVAYDDREDVWKVTWTFPEDLPPGTYSLAVRGSDAHGNTILVEETSGAAYEPGAINQLTGATVPGPGAALAALLGLVTAAAYGRVLSRR